MKLSARSVPAVLAVLTLMGVLTNGAAGQNAPAAPGEPPLPQVAAGHLERIAAVAAPGLAPRHVDVWVSEGCTAARRCPVLYMHDGQMLFDAGTTWNKQAWNVADTVARLQREGRLGGLVVVGIWNTGTTRFADYFPQKWLAGITDEATRKVVMERGMAGGPRADAYLRLIVETLKPEIDRRFPTLPGREHTAIAGSSMGGLISIYAALEHPQVFGAVAGISTHWIGGYERNAAIPAAAAAYLREKLPPPGTTRVWMDRGNTQLDAQYDQAQALIDTVFAERGWRSGPGYRSTVFEGKGHNERDWAARFDQVLLFLFGR
jgi:enterochelin esterase-like enzyme